MRINVYAEELTDRVEVITKQVDGKTFYGIRLYLYLPVSSKVVNGTEYAIDESIRGPFIHHEGDDDSAAITFWVPWTKAKGNDFNVLKKTLYELYERSLDAEHQEEKRFKAGADPVTTAAKIRREYEKEAEKESAANDGKVKATINGKNVCPNCHTASPYGGFIKTGQDGFGTVEGYNCTNEFHRNVDLDSSCGE